jgi:hypothetical protein
MIDPCEWTLPDPRAVITALDPRSRLGTRANWRFSDEISSVELYSYLKHRFGEPNGFAMTLRSPSVDNLIHWNYTLGSGPVILDLRGLDLHNEITAFLPPGTETPDWPTLEARLLEEFGREQDGMKTVRERFERWRLFVNPHQMLRVKLERQVKRLRELDIKNLHVPKDPSSAEELPQYQEHLARCVSTYQEAMALCIDVQLSAPVFAESAVSLLMHLLAKPELRADKRLFDDHCRRNIDVRVKGLHLVCDGFVGRIEGSEGPFKDFLSLMNRRNDRLHGNVDPTRNGGHEVYFDHRFIPLFAKSQGLTRLALEHALADTDSDAAIRDWEAARGFVAFLLTKLGRPARDGVELALAQQQLGYRPETRSIGVILPQARVALFPGHGPIPGRGDTA